MKRTITSMLGALAVAAGFSMFAPEAHAQTALQTISNGGVTCKQYSTGYATYPLSYWDCINTASPPTSAESVVGQSARDNLTSGMKTTLANVEIMIFQNRTDFASFTGASAPAAKYVAWTAPSGPGALSTKRIAAVFGQADLWSPNIAPTNQIATRDITASYKVHILQALGRQFDTLTTDDAKKSNYQETPVHLFPIAAGNYDKFWTNTVPVNTVWGSTLAGQYPGQTPWQIFGTLYGNTTADIYAFQFATQGGSNWSHLQQFINAYLLESQGYREQQIFGTIAAKPVSGVYKSATGAGVMCVEYTTIYAAPADKIQNCVHPYNYTAGEVQAGQGVGALPSGFRTSLNGLNPAVKLYVMYDIVAYNTFFNVNITGGGHVGITNIVAHRSVAFRDSLATFPGEVYNWYQGTLVHEVGHQLDELVWNNYSQTAAWNTIVNADKTLFNQIASCMTALNDAEACSTTDPLYAGKTNWDRFLTKMGLYGKTQGQINKEIFTYMFQRKSGSGTFPFMQYVENKLWTLSTPSMKNKMDSIWSTGAP